MRRKPVLCERLELRTLLNASLGSDGTLSILGTEANDLITYGPSSKAGRMSVTVNGIAFTFRQADVLRISASTLGGSDILQTSPLGIPLTADMGAGTDDRLEIDGTLGSDTFVVSANRVTAGPAIYNFNGACEEVSIFGASGAMDTVQLDSSAGVGTANVTFLASLDGSDIFYAQVPWTGRIYFDGAGGDDILYASAATNYTFFGGDGVDRLVIPTTAQSDTTSITNSSQVSVSTAAGFVRGAAFNNVEQLRVEVAPGVNTASGQVHKINMAGGSISGYGVTIFGSPDADQLFVNNNGSVPTNVQLLFTGDGGNDRLEMQNGVNLQATYHGGAGTDELIFTSGDGPDVIRADADSAEDAQSLVNHTGVEYTELRGERGDDTFYVTANLQTDFFVRAHRTGFAGDAGDSLSIDPGGGTPRAITYTAPKTDGTMWFYDRESVSFAGIDSLSRPVVNPTANAGGPYEVVEGTSIVLDGSQSQPFEGAITKYEWDFDYDGTTFNVDATGVSPSFSAVNLRYPRTMTVALRVTDEGPRTAISTSTVTVTQTQAPVANANGPYEVYVNGAVQLSSAGSSDPDGTIAAYEWDFDYDGITFDVQSTNPSPVYRPNNLPAGTVRTVGLRVRDNIGAYSAVSTTTITVKLSSAPTVNANGPYTTLERASFPLNASGTAGSGDSINRYEWDFDYDGVTFDVQAFQYPTGAWSYAHTFDGPSTRNIAVRVVTQQNQTAIATTTLQVNNVAPTVSISAANTSVNEAGFFTLNLSTGSDPGDTISSWEIDWGDGQVQTIPSNPTSVPHVYADGPAMRHITARATDEDGTYVATSPIQADPGFGPSAGFTTVDVGTSDAVSKVLVTPDGRTIAVGVSSGRIELAKWLADGKSLDPSFGGGGLRETFLSANVYDALLQPDGKILIAAGAYVGGSGQVTLLRYTANGNLDSSFSGDGIYQYDFLNGSSRAVDIELMADGRIVVGAQAPGAWRNSSGTIASYMNTFALLRILPDGTFDPSFGGGAPVNTTLSTSGDPSLSVDLHGIRVRADGSIVAVGLHTRNTFPSTTKDLAIATYSESGVLQNVQYRTSYGAPDMGSTKFTSDDEVVVGYVDAMVATYRLSDPAVRTIALNFGEALSDVLPQADGSLIIAGRVSTGAGGMLLLKFRPDGTRDTAFGPSGRVVISSGGSTLTNTAAQASPFQILIGGSLQNDRFLVGRFAVAAGALVQNVPPTITVDAPSSGQAGTPVAITFSATDPGLDTISGWQVSWGDGVTELLPAGATGASHTYTDAASYSIIVSAIDEDGAHAAAGKSIVIAPQWQITDRTLTMTGGTRIDTVRLDVITPGELRVTWQGNAFSIPLADFDDIVVLGKDSNDSLTVTAAVPKPVTFDGGAGVADSATFHATAADDDIVVDDDSVAVTFAGGSQTFRYLNLERVTVMGGAGNDAFTFDTGDVEILYALFSEAGNSTFEVISGPRTPPLPGYPAEYAAVQLVGNTGMDSAVVRGGANVSLSFNDTGSTSQTGPADSLLVEGTDGDDTYTVDSSFIRDGVSFISHRGIENVRIAGGGGNDLFNVIRMGGHMMTFDGGAGVDAFAVTPPAGAGTAGYILETARFLTSILISSFSFVDVESGSFVGDGARSDILTVSQPSAIAFLFRGGIGTATDTLNVNAGTYTLAADAGLTSSNLSINVGAGGQLEMQSTQRLAALRVNGGAARFTPGGGKVLLTRELSVSGGSFDLADNDAIIDYTGASPVGTWNDGAYTGLSGLIASGSNEGTWDGGGLITSMGNALRGKTTLGIADAADVLDFAGGATADWNGWTVDATSVLIKYTYAGDANLDGAIDADDYSAIDFSYRSAGIPAYVKGDFNLDGLTNADDYSLIDTNYRSQGDAL